MDALGHLWLVERKAPQGPRHSTTGCSEGTALQLLLQLRDQGKCHYCKEVEQGINWLVFLGLTWSLVLGLLIEVARALMRMVAEIDMQALHQIQSHIL